MVLIYINTQDGQETQTVVISYVIPVLEKDWCFAYHYIKITLNKFTETMLH